MAVSRGQTPPVNLKERIAALQQRNVSPSAHPSTQTSPKGIPTPGSGGLRDKIARFEEKGGVPVPRASFGMAAPQLAENAPTKKRGELYGNRVPSLGKPSGHPVSHSGSSADDDSPGPRKRCVSTGTGLSSDAPSVLEDEPVPPLPNGLPSTARRNSLANSGKRVMGSTEAEGSGVEPVDASSPSPSSLAPTKPTEAAEELSPTPVSASPAVEPAANATPMKVEEAQPPSLDVPKDTPKPSEPPPVAKQSLPADSGISKVASPPPEDPPVSKKSSLPVYAASRSVSQSSAAERSSSKDGTSEYESAPQSAVSQSSSSLSKSTSAASLTNTPSLIPKLSRPESGVGLTIVSPEKLKSSRSITVSVPSPIDSEPPKPNPTEARSQGKSSFKAVVHRKVPEAPAPATGSSLAPPVTPQTTKQRRSAGGSGVEVSPSLGTGDLALLLEDAALLELRLTGEGASPMAKEAAATPTTATFQANPRNATTSSEHTSAPSVGSGSQSGRSIPSIRETLADSEIPEGDETDGRSLASTTFSQRSPSHRNYLYRLTSRRSSSYIAGNYPRDSMSMSSEDSSPVTTPSDSGKRKGFGIAWPTASPKKSGPNVGRSSSFADKIFNRNRTKSNVSSDQASERNSMYEPSQPSLTLTFPSEEKRGVGVDSGARPTSWISPGNSTAEFSPAPSLLDKDLFDAFPSVPQTLPTGFQPEVESSGAARASTLPVKGRKQVNQRLSMA